jgi:hypothetical protein
LSYLGWCSLTYCSTKANKCTLLLLPLLFRLPVLQLLQRHTF